MTRDTETQLADLKAMREASRLEHPLSPSNNLSVKLLDTMFKDMTDAEEEYLGYLVPRVRKGTISTARARELFSRRFPNSKWLIMQGGNERSRY